MSTDRGERRLLVGFGALVILIVLIGLLSIFQIQSLASTIRAFGQRHLPREQEILTMKTTNALYAAGVRNYVFWRTSQYLQGASIASDVNALERSVSDFQRSRAGYAVLATSPDQLAWASRLEESAGDLHRLGREITQLADADMPDKDRINKLLMAFEDRSYRIDALLTETLSKDNLAAIDAQLTRTSHQRRASVLILALSVVCSVTLGAGIARYVYRSLKTERQIRARLVQRMINMEEEERKNLSRQLHDQLSQDLSALKIYLGLIERDLQPDMAEQKERLEKSKKILGTLIERGHHISELLRPSELDELGLVESTATLVSEHQEITGCRYHFRRPASDIRVSSEQGLVLYRVVQEALTNIAKHANAANVEIVLEQKADAVRLSVTDDGVGFDYQELLRRPRRRKDDPLKLGLLGLRERVELLGGKFDTVTAPGKGTTIRVEVAV